MKLLCETHFHFTKRHNFKLVIMKSICRQQCKGGLMLKFLPENIVEEGENAG